MGIVSRHHGAVAEIMLDWPDIRNALDPDRARELRLAVEAMAADQAVAAILMTANGKAFCAGGDLVAVSRLAADKATLQDKIYNEFQGLVRSIRASRVPVIVAVDGPAIGLGCDLALAGSVTFIGKEGWLSQGWIRAGLIPATGGTLFAMERGGRQAVWRLLAADRVDGPTAEGWGLGIACESAQQAGLELAEKLASFPVQQIRAVADLTSIEDQEAHLSAALGHQIGFITAPDFAERVDRLLRR